MRRRKVASSMLLQYCPSSMESSMLLPLELKRTNTLWSRSRQSRKAPSLDADGRCGSGMKCSRTVAEKAGRAFLDLFDLEEHSNVTFKIQILVCTSSRPSSQCAIVLDQMHLSFCIDRKGPYLSVCSVICMSIISTYSCSIIVA